MSGKGAYEVLDGYIQPIQSALHCITPTKLRYRRVELNVNGVLDTEQSPVQLRRRDRVSGTRLDPVNLLAINRYRVVRGPDALGSEGYQIIPTSYEYTILNDQLREVIAFHWHPGQRSHEHNPHIHIGSIMVDSGSTDFGRAFSRFHIPTGHIAIAQVVRLLLTDFNVVPNRQDWESVLSQLNMMAG